MPIELQTFDRFEYYVTTLDDETSCYRLNKKLDELGKEGWELKFINTSSTGQHEYIFMRKVNCMITG